MLAACQERPVEHAICSTLQRNLAIVSTAMAVLSYHTALCAHTHNMNDPLRHIPASALCLLCCDCSALTALHVKVRCVPHNWPRCVTLSCGRAQVSIQMPLPTHASTSITKPHWRQDHRLVGRRLHSKTYMSCAYVHLRQVRCSAHDRHEQCASCGTCLYIGCAILLNCTTLNPSNTDRTCVGTNPLHRCTSKFHSLVFALHQAGRDGAAGGVSTDTSIVRHHSTALKDAQQQQHCEGQRLSDA
jgi:hypothetical protein